MATRAETSGLMAVFGSSWSLDYTQFTGDMAIDYVAGQVSERSKEGGIVTKSVRVPNEGWLQLFFV